MNIENRLLKESNNNHKLNLKMIPLNNISIDFSKTTKILNNNFLNKQNNVLINQNLHNTNINHKNYLLNKKLFKNTKLYNVVKSNKLIKKRNNSNALIHNIIPGSSLTEGNFNNNNSKNIISLFHTNTLKINNRNLKFKKNKINNNAIKADINSLLHNSNSFNILKSKYNVGIINQPTIKNLIIHTREKADINTNNTKNIRTISNNNYSMKNIKNNSGINRNNKKIINTNIHEISSFNNKPSDSIPKRGGETRERIKELKNENEKYKKEIIRKNEIIKSHISKINKISNSYEECKKLLNDIQTRYDELKKDYNIMKNNYLLLKEKLIESEKKNKSMKLKEIKLMQVLYLIRENGIDINLFLNEANQVTFHEPTPCSFSENNNKNNGENKNLNNNNNSNKDNNKNQENEEKKDNKENNENIDCNLINNNIIEDNNINESGLSSITAYFPDKVKMNNIMESEWGKNIPKLNFGNVPEYSSDSDSQQQNNNNTLIEDLNYYFPKFNKFQYSA